MSWPWALLLFVPHGAYGIGLPKFETRQDVSNIRYLSDDGQYTYYQMRSGKLILSLNYKVEEVLSGPPGSHYEIIDSPNKKYLLVAQDTSYQSNFSPQKEKSLYLVAYGKSHAREVGSGGRPSFHLGGTWVSFYSPSKKTLFFKNVISPSIQFSITLNNPLSRYFFPSSVMLEKNLVLYTDINNKGQQGLLLFDQSQQVMVHKLSNVTHRIELCHHQDRIFVGVFPQINSKNLSKVYMISLSPSSLKEKKFGMEEIYSSSGGDIGNIVCSFDNEKFYFIKDFSTEKRIFFDVAEFNLSGRQLTRLTNNGRIFQYFHLDKKLIISHQGEYYVLKGKLNFKNQDQLGQ